MCQLTLRHVRRYARGHIDPRQVTLELVEDVSLAEGESTPTTTVTGAIKLPSSRDCARVALSI